MQLHLKKTSKWKWLQPYDLLSIHDDLFSQTRIFQQKTYKLPFYISLIKSLNYLVIEN